MKRERNKSRASSDGPKFFLVLVSEGISRTCAVGVCCSTAGHFVVCRQHNLFPFCTSQQSTGHHAAALSTAQLYRRTSGHRLGNVRAVTGLIRPVPLTAPCPQSGSSDSSLIQSCHYGHNLNIFTLLTLTQKWLNHKGTTAAFQVVTVVLHGELNCDLGSVGPQTFRRMKV